MGQAVAKTFQLAKATTFLTPDAPGIAVLAAALRSGASIHAGKGPKGPIQTRRDADQVLVCETSGTTGRAKAIRRRPISWIRSFDVNAQAFSLGHADTYATLGALEHSLTLYAVLEACHLGADIALLDGRTRGQQFGDLRRNRATVLYATPTQLRVLLSGWSTKTGVLADLRCIFVGGGKLDTKLRSAVQEIAPNAQVLEFYGASETSFISMSNASAPAGSVGKPYPGVQINVRPIEGLDEPDLGEIWISSPYLFDGYSSGSSPHTRWDQEWLTIGEVGYFDADGFLYLRGRRQRMVTVADQNVFLEDIEAILNRDAQVEMCAAVPVPDTLRGHSVVAFVSGPKGDDAKHRLRDLCHDHLPSHAVPRHIHILDDFPTLPAGKPDLVALETLLEQGR